MEYSNRLWTALSASLASALLLGACQGRVAGIPPASIDEHSLDSVFPAPSKLHDYHQGQAAGRTASSSAGAVTSGAAFDLSLPIQNTGPGIGTAVYSPATVPGDEFSTMAYACYRFGVPGYAGTAEVKAYFDPAPASGEAYIGVANFSTDRWDWYKRSNPLAMSFGSVADHQDAVGDIFVAIVVLGTNQAELKLLRLGQPQLDGDLTQTPQAGIAPVMKAYDISGLYVDGETILGCNWDFENDGTDDDTGLGVHFQSYLTPGDFPLKLTVQTDLGDEISRVFPVRAMSGIWDVSTEAFIPSGLHHFFSPHIALVGGVPMLAYIHKFDGDPPNFPAYQAIELIAADDRFAHSWHYVIQPLPLWVHDRIYSLVDVNGLPHILAANTGQAELVYPPDPSLNNWFTLTFASALVGIEREADMAVVGGNLSAAWRDSGSTIWYTCCSGLDPQTWSSPLDTGLAGDGTLSLADVNGTPGIAATTFAGTTQIMYIFSNSPTGIAGSWTIYYLNPSYDATPSLAYVGGYPVIAMDSPFDFYYAAGSAPDGTVTWRGFAPTGGMWMGDWCSIAGPCLDALAGIVSKNTIDNSLTFTLIHDDGSNLSNSTPTPIDSAFGVDLGEHCDLICVDGVPMTVYEDTTNQSIKVAVMR